MSLNKLYYFAEVTKLMAISKLPFFVATVSNLYMELGGDRKSPARSLFGHTGNENRGLLGSDPKACPSMVTHAVTHSIEVKS